MVIDPFGEDIPNDNPMALLYEWVDQLRKAKSADKVIGLRLTSGSLHTGKVSEVRRATVVLDVIVGGERYVEHIALQAIAALTIQK